MFNLGPMEIGVILVLALLVFGPKKLPEIGKGLGQALREFKRTSSELMGTFHEAMEERPRSPAMTDTYAAAGGESHYPYQPPADTYPTSPPTGSYPSGEAHAEPVHLDANPPSSAPAPGPAAPDGAASLETGAATVTPRHDTARAPERTT